MWLCLVSIPQSPPSALCPSVTAHPAVPPKLISQADQGAHPAKNIPSRFFLPAYFYSQSCRRSGNLSDPPDLKWWVGSNNLKWVKQSRELDPPSSLDSWVCHRAKHFMSFCPFSSPVNGEVSVCGEFHSDARDREEKRQADEHQIKKNTRPMGRAER